MPCSVFLRPSGRGISTQRARGKQGEYLASNFDKIWGVFIIDLNFSG